MFSKVTKALVENTPLFFWANYGFLFAKPIK